MPSLADAQSVRDLGAVQPVSGTVGISGIIASVPSATSNSAGTLVSKIQSTASTNAVNIKTGSSRLYGVVLANKAATTLYVRLYNKATAPVAGTDSPAMVIPVLAGSTLREYFSVPISFSLGLGIAITGLAADLDATITAADDVIGSVLYI